MLIAAAALWALPALAQESQIKRDGQDWVQVVTGTLPAARVLKVTTPIGAVQVTGGSQQGIQYTVTKKICVEEGEARRQLEGFRISAASRGDTAIIEANADRGRYKRFSVQFTISVPRELGSLKVETSAGSIWVNNIAGSAAVETSGGSINLNDIGGNITASTAGGSIEVGNSGGDVSLETQGGGIVLRNVKGKVGASTAGGSIFVESAGQAVVAETAGGSINVKQCGGELKATTAGGSVDVGDVNGGAVLETSGGSIRLNSATGPVKASTAGGGIHLYKLMRGVKAETAAGSITAEFIGKPADFTESYLATSVGDVVVYLPADMKVTVKAVIETALGHKIRSDFPELKITSEGGDWGPKEVYASGQINGGGPVLKLRTTLGNIELRKGKR